MSPQPWKYGFSQGASPLWERRITLRVWAADEDGAAQQARSLTGRLTPEAIATLAGDEWEDDDVAHLEISLITRPD
jgi:hypothetical protein